MRVLDLFCGAGGAAWGYHLAWPDAEIVGVDIRPMPRYPFAFVQGDALAYLREHGHEFDFIHASPPCQEHTSLKVVADRKRAGAAPDFHTDRLPETRALLDEWGGAYIIENVVGAPLNFSVELCGLTFGLRVYRHRRFEAPFLMIAPPHLTHRLPALSHRNPTNGLSRKESYMAGLSFATVTGNVGSYVGPGMGIDWMTGDELSQAIPPAYTAYLAQFVPVALGVAA